MCLPCEYTLRFFLYFPQLLTCNVVALNGLFMLMRRYSLTPCAVCMNIVMSECAVLASCHSHPSAPLFYLCQYFKNGMLLLLPFYIFFRIRNVSSMLILKVCHCYVFRHRLVGRTDRQTDVICTLVILTAYIGSSAVLLLVFLHVIWSDNFTVYSYGCVFLSPHHGEIKISKLHAADECGVDADVQWSVVDRVSSTLTTPCPLISCALWIVATHRRTCRTAHLYTL